ncbi:MAG: amino acid adenylation domain-containing protein, partial [Gammaproteobacteria bacterium]
MAETAILDLRLSITDMHQRLQGTWEYNTDLFDAETIERMAGHFQVLLEGNVRNPDARISELPLLTEEERHTILERWNDTAAAYPRDACIHELFQAQAAETPDRIAVVWGEEHVSYEALGRRAKRLAGHLQALGVGPEVLVGVCTGRTVEMVTGVLGVLEAGGGYVPLDPAYPAQRLAFILQDTQAAVVLADRGTRAQVAGQDGRQVVQLEGPWEGAVETPSGVSGKNLAYVIYTSGSTGRPKGVAIAHSSAAALIGWARGVFDEALVEGVLASTSICFDLSVFELFLPLATGGTVILAETALHLPEMRGRERVRLVNTVPSAMKELVQRGLPRGVRLVNLAGELLKTSLVEEVYGQGVEAVYDLYGPSEDTTYTTWGRREPGEPPSIGRPVSNTQVYLLDENLAPVPVGVTGELYTAGAGLARGYLGRPGLTADRFVPNPFSSDGARLYRTGDLARYRADGRIEFLGRRDHQVKVRGYRIELGEVEEALVRLAAVKEAVVVAREDGGGHRQLVAYVVEEADGPSCDGGSAGLRRELGEVLPGYMVPSLFVALEALPLTPNGKVDRRALPAPEWARPGFEGSLGPQTPTQEIVAGIWAEVLSIDGPGIDDDFFDLGGHSLLATRVASRLSKAFGVDLSLHVIFDASTIAGLAERVETLMGTAAEHETRIPPVRPASRTDPLPLSFAQQQLWLIDQLQPGSAAYNIPLLVRIEGELNIAALQRALSEVIRRHEVLRTTFVIQDEQPIQYI